MSENPQDKARVSRRSFLQGAGVGAALSSAALATSEPVIAAGPGVFGPGPTPITLQINGRAHRLEVEPRTTLLDALRNDLGLTGAKKVCDRATCGACTVLVDDRPVYSCTVLAVEAQATRIATIEGLGSPERPHPLQSAFVEYDAQQCGFCTPGFVMACKSLLDRQPKPTPDQVRQQLGGNLCRCGTYNGIVQAVLAAARS